MRDNLMAVKNNTVRVIIILTIIQYLQLKIYKDEFCQVDYEDAQSENLRKRS